MNLRFLLIYISVISLMSCATSLGELRQLPVAVMPELRELFPNDKKELLYDMSIKFLNNYNSGILVVARDTMDHGSYRTVFMAKAGLKLFDFEFSEEEMNISYIFPQLDKKLVKKILEQDLRMLLDPLKIGIYDFRQSEKNRDLIGSVKKEDAYYHYFFDRDGIISRIDRGRKNNSAVVMELSYGVNNWPQSVRINHKKIPFFMQLNKIASEN